jgi:pSer/pThr/pTyr-binding forkhead associated (FHA) protein
MEEIAESEGDADTTIFSLPEVMTLARSSDGRAIPAPSGCVLGRSGEMAAYFEENLTVSRHHARVLYRDGIWKIEDLGSTNGTWINGNRIETGKQHTLQKGDTVALSMACELRVIS